MQLPASCTEREAELFDTIIAGRHTRKKSICSLQSLYFPLLQKCLIAFPSSVLTLPYFLVSGCHYTIAVAKRGIWSLVRSWGYEEGPGSKGSGSWNGVGTPVLPVGEQEELSGEIF